MSSTNWNKPALMMRGTVVESANNSSVEDLSSCVEECWAEVAALSKELAKPGEPIRIACEIWPDTGRIIWILKDRREFCRLELTASEIERTYFGMLHSSTFESEYESLIEKLKCLVRNGFKTSQPSFALEVVVRDSDTQESEDILYP